MVKPKKVFPLLYFSVFVYILWKQFISFDPATSLLSGVVGENNINTYVMTIKGSVLLTSILLIIMYIKLEIFEHENREEMQPLMAKIEFTLRLLLVGMIANKFLGFYKLDNLISFITILMLLFVIWNIINDKIDFTKELGEKLLLLFSFILAFISYFIGFDKEQAITQIMILNLLSILLIVNIFIFMSKCKLNFQTIKEYVTKWN